MCRTAFSTPPLNDGRDLFNDILKSEWKIAKKLYEIVQYIPDFIADIITTEEEMKVYGKFHLGETYDITEWGMDSQNKDAKIFECEEQDESDDELFYKRFMVVTQSALILLEPGTSIKNNATCLSWATL